MKKTNLKITLLSLVLMLVSVRAFGVTINGISYELGEEGGLYIATVIPSELGGGKYSGAITIPSWVDYNGMSYAVTAIEKGAFRNCTNLTSITTSDGDWAFGGIYIGEEAFMGCTNLTSVNILVSFIGYNAFNGCTKLKTLNLKNNSSAYILDNAFYGCTGLTSIDLSSVENIGSLAFAECTNLSSVTLGHELTYIGHHAFAFCKELTSIVLPSDLIEINDYAFSGCSKLASVTFNNPSTFGSGVFNNCSAIRELHVDSETPPAIEKFTFYGLDKSLCKLYVPSGAMSAYQTADVWKDFTDITDKRPRCAWPELSIEDGRMQIKSDTPNAVVYYKFDIDEHLVETPDKLTFHEVLFCIEAYAVAPGYENSYEVRMSEWSDEIRNKLQGLKGDVNGDNQVNISDVTTLVNIILNKQ